MQLLDTMLAFVLTLAALATVVTVIMEVALRIARMRQKNLVEVMKLLNQELKSTTIAGQVLQPGERWRFIEAVVTNLGSVSENERTELLPEPQALQNAAPKLDDTKLDDKLGALRKPKLFDGNTFLEKLKHALRDDRYETVSLEHVLRRLADLPSVQEYAKKGLDVADTLKVEFNRLALRYEQFASSVAATFRQSSQFWSMVIGVLLAFAMNVDGLRIFMAYQANTDLAEVVIAQRAEFAATYKDAKARAEQLELAEKAVQDAKKKLEDANQQKKSEDEIAGLKQIAELKQEVKKEEAALAQLTSLETIQDSATKGTEQLTKLIELGVPIGWSDKVFEDWDLYEYLTWPISVTLTGMLIGLGAPFWFDVAKRLGAIRKGNQPIDSEESRMTARDANGSPVTRKEIVHDVIDDALLREDPKLTAKLKIEAAAQRSGNTDAQDSGQT